MDKKMVKLVIAVAILLVIALYFVGGTYARYTSEFTGSGTVSVAKWAVKAGEQDSGTFNLDFEVETNENVVNDKIAPSVKAVAPLKLDLTGTEVAVDVIVEKGDDFSAKLTEAGLTEEQVKFGIKVAPDSQDKLKPSDEGDGSKQKPFVIPLPDGAAFDNSTGLISIELTVQWDNDESRNTDDTTAGKKGGSLTLPVKVTVQQHIDKV